MKIDERYMRRALDLAAHGKGSVSPNPMVGAVIVDTGGRIIGEGYHRRYGGPHAEVNAVASVKDPGSLHDSTMYVTLEPCSHYGKTPPCAKLIIDSGIPRVVVGAVDPFEKVSGRGIAMLRDAGIEVATGVLSDECSRLNARFITAHTLRRPFVTLKWAQSADGYMDVIRDRGESPAAISTRLTRTLVHRLRSLHDAILVGAGTVIADDPLLDTRLWGGNAPRPVILDRRRLVDGDFRINSRDPIVITDEMPLADMLHRLYDGGITSLLVEGGASVLRSFIDDGIWDIARVETSPTLFGAKGKAVAPKLQVAETSTFDIDDNKIHIYVNNPLFDVKNL